VPFNGKFSSASLGINQQGFVIGSIFKGPDEKAFLRLAHRTELASVPHAPYVTVGVAINDRNEVVMSGIDLSFNEYSYVYRNGTFTALAPPGGVSVNGWGCASNSGSINNAGVVAGSYGYSGGVRGFTLSGGKYRSYEFPGQKMQTTVSGVSANAVAGCYLDTSDGVVSKGFIYITGGYHTILVPGSVTTWIVGINAKNSLIGQFASSAANGVFIAQCKPDQAPCTQ
jgi:hypothetical protein